MAESIRKAWPSLLGGVLGGIVSLLVLTFTTGQTSGAYQERLKAVEVEQVSIKARQDRLELQIYERLGRMENTLTRIDAEQCVYHRGQGCEARTK